MAFKKILVIKLRSLGDTVIMTSSLDRISKAFPNAQIDVLVTGHWSAVLENHPAIRKVMSFEGKSMIRWAFRLRKKSYDCVINLHASPSSSLLAWMTGAPVRSIHFHGHRDANRFSTVTVPGKGSVKPAIERDLDAIRALGIDTEAVLPRVFLKEEEIQNTKNEFKARGFIRPFLAVSIGASRPTKKWPVENFIRLAERWKKETGGSVAFFLGPGESLPQTDFPVFQNLPIRLFAAWLNQVDVWVGNDSGPKHLAISVGTKTLTFFGPEDPFEWHPYPVDRNPFLYSKDLTCRIAADPGQPPWCGLNTCVDQKHRCLEGISVEMAWAALIHLKQQPNLQDTTS